MAQEQVSSRPREDVGGGRLFSLYERYVGEPDSTTDVYGYWTFIVGALIGLGGVLLFVTGWAVVQDAFPDSREWAITSGIAALGLPVALLGLVMLLPVRRSGLQAAIAGTGLAVVGVFAYIAAYPAYWRFGEGAMEVTIGIIAVYTVGVGLIAAIAALVPLVTGREARFVQEELSENRDQPPIMVGAAERGAVFSVYPVTAGEWTWRAIRQEAIARGLTETDARTDAKDAVETVRQKVGEAGLMEITTAAFRLYEDEHGRWRWTLMRDDGSVLADSAGRKPNRDEADASVSFTKEYAPEAPVIDIEGAAVDVYRDAGRWRWRLLDEHRTVIGEGVGDHDGRDPAEDAFEHARDLFGEARMLAIEGVAAELYRDGDDWRFGVRNENDELIAESAQTFGGRRPAESAAQHALERATDATVIDRGTSRYEIHPDGDGWRVRLVGDDDDVAARGLHHADPVGARGTAARVSNTVGDSDVVEIDEAAFEIYPAETATDGGEIEPVENGDKEGDGSDDTGTDADDDTGTDADEDDGRRWHWRFVGDDRTVVADRREGYTSPEEATEAIERVRAQALGADLIEFETAAFQQYEDASGSWRWRLIDADGNVMADSGDAYESKADASNAMVTLKEHAPDAELLEIETAAFELFEDDEGWGWRLIDEGGWQVAAGARRYDTRGEARQSMDFLVENAEATIRTMDAPIVQRYAGDDEWRWRYVDVDNTVLLEGADTHATRDEIDERIGTIRAGAAGAPLHVIEDGAVEVDPDTGWRWTLVDAEREPLAEGTGRYPDGDTAREEVDLLRRTASNATVFELDGAAVRVVRADAGWRWELIDGDRNVLAIAPGAVDGRQAAVDAATRIIDLAPEAGSVDLETAGFELKRSEEGWRWRLLDGKERVMAAGATPHEEKADALSALEEVRGLVDGASVIDIDDPAFELHLAETGWLWRLVDENGTPLAESLPVFESREAAREAMTELKEHAPESAVSVQA